MDVPPLDAPELPTYLFEPSLQGIISLLVTLVLPLVAGLLSKRSWSPTVKGLILLGVTAVKTYIEAWLAAKNAGEPFDTYTVGYAALLNFGVALLSYFGFLKGSTVQQAALDSGVKDKPAQPRLTST